MGSSGGASPSGGLGDTVEGAVDYIGGLLGGLLGGSGHKSGGHQGDDDGSDKGLLSRQGRLCGLGGRGL